MALAADPDARIASRKEITMMRLPLKFAVFAFLLSVACDEASARRPKSTSVALPTEPAALHERLLTEIPDLLAKVPCSCCAYTIATCYRGACPLTCEPCNTIGREAYALHQEGLSDADIVARIKASHPRTGGHSHRQ